MWLYAAPVSGQSASGDDSEIPSPALGAETQYPVLKRGQVVLVNAQRFVVTREPPPVASVQEAPPEPLVDEGEADRPPAPSKNAVWVSGHWMYGAGGFVWVAGRYITARVGHVFVPPRWAAYQEQYLFFSGFYVPYGVYVRSHFNRYYYSGVAENVTHATRGPYWPIGAPAPASGPLTSASPRRDPYWPVGARR